MVAELNKQQAAAAYTESPCALILASAGSGKTRTLIERIEYLINEKHVAPSEILAFTFTRTAANEMKARLVESIGSKAHGVYMSTMHGIGLTLLRRYGELIGVKGHELTVYSEWETDVLLRDVAGEVGVLRGKAWNPRKKDVQATFSRFESTGVPPEETDPCYVLFKSFFQRCKEHNAMPYSGLIHGFKALVENGILDGKMYWKHVLVDECQDIDKLQWSIINAVKERFNANLFAVGDDSQAIFSFRGAVPEYLVENQDSFDIYRLENNYRCHPEVVKYANSLITHNINRLPLTMKAMIQDTSRGVDILTNKDSSALANNIQGWIETGQWEPGEITVLARNHVLLSKLDDELTNRGIPCARIGKQAGLTRTEEFRRAIAPMNLVINPYDNFSFLLIWERLGISSDEYREIRRNALADGLSHFQVWERDYSPAAPHSLIASGETRLSLFWDCCEKDNIPPVNDFIQAWLGQFPKGTVSQFLEWLLFFEVQDEEKMEDAETKVRLMTIHASKGREFPFVIVAGCNEDILPSKQAKKDPGGIEEERRLAYVAWTRAQKHLALSVRPEIKVYPGVDGKSERTINSPISRFIHESLKTI